MKFLVHSNAPHAATGYGVQTALLCDRLAEAGHEVAVSCTWGHSGEIGVWTSPKGHRIRLYPMGFAVNSVDSIHMHAGHFFEGDPSQGWIIPLLDVWCLAPNTALIDWQIAAWTPVDHLPVPPLVLKFFENNPQAIPIAMSRFGEEMLRMAGLDPLYAPLAMEADLYKPTETVFTEAEGAIPVRRLFTIPEDAFVVGMAAMNKDKGDRKNFDGAFRAMGQFLHQHEDAVFHVHSEVHGGMDGLDLLDLARNAGIPMDRLIWSDQYALRLGLPTEMMAALYSSYDVLLAPSAGEGFGVPLIEAQACGTPVIVSDFSAQPELVGAGWTVAGQLRWDLAQRSSYIDPFHADILAKLNEAYESLPDPAASEQAVEFASGYDADHVFSEYWGPVLAALDPPPPEPKPKLEEVDVIVPLMREENTARLLDSLGQYACVNVLAGTNVGQTYAQNVNEQYARSKADWVLIVGDDVEFTPGWLEAAIEASEFADVIGTNDSEPGRIRNPDVAAGRHADHFLIRRSYIEEQGASLDGPGTLVHEGYGHWYVDKELIELAKARGVFVFARECVIIHHHPGYDGDDEARAADPFYMRAMDCADEDKKLFLSRAPLIESHRVGR